MEKITLKQRARTRAARRKITFLLAFCATNAIAQVNNIGNLYIADNVTMQVFSGDFNFGSPASTVTTRTASTNGVLSFGSGATWSGASNSHFIDGYARFIGASAMTFPIGQSGVYAPVKAVPSASAIIDAAYYSASPATIGSTLDADINAISSSEYWHIKGGSSQAAVTLTWRSTSGVNALTGGDIANLAIAAWDGAKWIQIPSTVDTSALTGGASNLNSGSITTDSSVDMSSYSSFTLANKGDCVPLIASSGIIKTWNGSWSPSAPTLADPAIINAPYSGPLACNSLVLNADVTLANGQTAEIINDVTGSGAFVMSSEASVVQRNSASTAPKIKLTKITRPMRRYDYIYLSNPLNNATTYFGQANSRAYTAVNGNFNTYPASALENFRNYLADGSLSGQLSSFPVGTGFRARVKSQLPYSVVNTAGSWNNQYNAIHLKAEGTTNNGNVSVTVPAANYIFVGNPYPSAIDAGTLLKNAGTNIEQTIWYWSFATPAFLTGANLFTYNPNDFSTWTEAGGVTSCGGCPIPDGTIATMQSVILAGSGTSATPITFNLTNCMRITGNNSTFFRMASQIPNRYRLNLNGSDGSFSQTLITYLPNATLGYDNGLDGYRFVSGLTSRVSSLINNAEMAIQARPAFEDTDIVPLKVSKANNETLTISLATKEGVFNEGQKIYLHDIGLGIYHDFADGSYTFTQDIDSDSSRFEIVYNAPTLGIGEVQGANALANIRNNTFTATAGRAMTHIDIFDMLGRKVISYEADGEKNISKPFNHAQGVYIAKIKLDNGAIATVKLTNGN